MNETDVMAQVREGNRQREREREIVERRKKSEENRTTEGPMNKVKRR